MKKKILVIDDDRINAKIVKLNLIKEGFHVETAFDGDEGLSVVVGVNPDLIVLDVNMPNMNGYTFMLEIQKLELQKETPVIVLTAQPDVRPIFKFNGVKDYLVKPISGPDLVEKVKNMSVENTQMPDPKQLPYLLNLLDDESAEIRAEIVRHLTAFGTTLKEELAKLPLEMVQARTIALEKILLKYDRETLLQRWSSWEEQSLDLEKLEAALSLLAEFQSGLKFQYSTQSVRVLLDNLATEYLAFAQENNPLELAKFLFEFKGYTGAKTDYYNPQCSNLLYVLNEKRGLPISLACIYILVGARLGFVIEGYNFPGHFMAKIFVKSKWVLVDCFNGGKILQEKEVLHSGPAIDEHDSVPAQAGDIVRRVLNNLINAYQAQGENDHQQLMVELYRTIQEPST